MTRTWRSAPIVLAACICLSLSAGPAAAQFGVITLKSIDDTMKAVHLVLEQAGEKDKAAQLDGMITALTGGKGFPGIDHKKPLGIYVGIPNEIGDKPPIVAFIPVTKKDDLLTFLKLLQVEVGEPENDIYKLTPSNGTSTYLRFAHDHAYVSDDADNLKGKLPAPAKFLPADSKTHLIAASLRLGQLSKEKKQQALDQISARIEERKKEEAEESPAEWAARLFSFDVTQRALAAVIRDGEDLSLALDIDPKTEKISLDLSVAGAAKSALAENLNAFGAVRSRFSGLSDDSAFNLFFAVSASKELRDALDKLLDEKYLQEKVDKTKTSKERTLPEKVLREAISTNTLDFALITAGPYEDNKVSIILAFQVKNGKKLDDELRSLLKERSADKDRGGFKLDHAKVGDTSIHWFKPAKVPDNSAKKILGNEEVFIAARHDAVLLSAGSHGLEALKDALARLNQPAKATTHPLRFDLSMAFFARLAENSDEELGKAIGKVFAGAGKNQDRVRLGLQGGKSLRLRLEAPLQIIKVGAALAKLQGENE